MEQTNTPSTAAQTKFIRKYRLSFFYENYSNQESEYIALMDSNGGCESVVQAATICRLDCLMVNGGGREIGWERKIGVSLTAVEDTFKKAQGRQIALLRATHELQRDERQMVLENWFREHPGVPNARKGDPKKFSRLSSMAQLSEESLGFMMAPWPQVVGDKVPA